MLQLVPITDKEFGPNSRVRSASVVDPWVFLVLDSGKVLVYEVNTKTKELEAHSKISAIEVWPLSLWADDRANLCVVACSRVDRMTFCRSKLSLDLPLLPTRLLLSKERGKMTKMLIFMERQKRRRRNLEEEIKMISLVRN
jgi:hypothetical protein